MNPLRNTLFKATWLLCLGVASGAAPAPAPATATAPASISVAGTVTKPQTWTVSEIKAAFGKDGKSIKYTLKEVNHSAQAVPLYAMVNACTPQLDAKIKNDQLRLVVVVEGKDGYMATFALTELTPEGGNREAWITLDMDDKPLSERDSPANLIVPGDQKPERWVHGVKTIRLVHIEPATKP